MVLYDLEFSGSQIIHLSDTSHLIVKINGDTILILKKSKTIKNGDVFSKYEEKDAHFITVCHHDYDTV